MKVTVFGGTGFVGQYLIDALVDAGMHPTLLVRPGSSSRVNRPDDCDTVEGDVDDGEAIAEAIRGADAVIYNIGILREFQRLGITFEALQERAPIRVIDAAQALGVPRCLLMSANGVDAASTAYQRTKLAAERHLQRSGLEWTIFRPSVIFGDPRGRMEFASQLNSEIIDSPMPAPLFFPGLNPSAAGRFKLSPVHVRDVADAFIQALLQPSTVGQTLHLGGPDDLSWRQILTLIAKATGRQKLMLPVPALGVSTAASLFDRWERFPITRDQIRMLLQGNCCSSADLAGLGIQATPFDADSLRYLSASSPEASSSRQDAV